MSKQLKKNVWADGGVSKQMAPPAASSTPHIANERAIVRPPILADYGIDSTTGFISRNRMPLARLTSAYFEPWESIVDHLHQLLLAGTLRNRVKALPELEIDDILGNSSELTRANLVLCLIAHAYIVGLSKIDSPVSILPSAVARPWLNITKALGIKPMISYSAVEIANWYMLDPNGPADLTNLTIRHTFTGTHDERWFYLVSLASEAIGGPALQGFVDAQTAILDKTDLDGNGPLADALENIANVTKQLPTLLRRMYERCDANVFWHHIRPYLNGSKNATDLPHGLFFEGVTEMDEHVNTSAQNPDGLVGTWRLYGGGSGMQSPLFQAIDAGLRIHHAPIGQPGSARVNPVYEMRAYIDTKHRQFIEEIAAGPSIQDYVATLPPSSRAVAEYNLAVDSMKEFRSVHIQIATFYIMLPKQREEKANRDKSNGSIASDSQSIANNSPKSTAGSGGTELMPFLKQMRNETANAIISTSFIH